MVVGQNQPDEDEFDSVYADEPRLKRQPVGIIHKLTTPRVATLDDTIQALQDLKRSGAPGDTPIGVAHNEQDVYKKAKELSAQKGRALTDDQINSMKRAEIRYWVEFLL